MSIYKDKIKELLWKVGVWDTLPASVINNVKIKDNNEELVDIKIDESFFFADELEIRPRVLLRSSVYRKLKEVQILLPENYHLKIYSAYRPIEEQQELWKEKYDNAKKNNPNLSEQELIKKVKAFCADPRSGFGGHQTGGAVDICLCDTQGINYDMGTKYREINQNTATNSKKLQITQKNNREILKMSM